MATDLFNESFPGADGDPWDAVRWQLVGTRGTNDRTILGNAGRLVIGGSTSPQIRLKANRTAINDFRPSFDGEWSGRWRILQNASDTPRIAFGLRAINDGWNNIAPIGGSRPRGYSVVYFANAIVGYKSNGVHNTSPISLGSVGVGFTLAVNEWARFRFQVLRDLVRAKMWKEGQAEPGWTFSVTDQDYKNDSIGFPYLFYEKGNTSAQTAIFQVDDLAITNLSSVKVWNGVAWVPSTIRRWNGAAWVSERPKVWNGATWVER